MYVYIYMYVISFQMKLWVQRVQKSTAQPGPGSGTSTPVVNPMPASYPVLRKWRLNHSWDLRNVGMKFIEVALDWPWLTLIALDGPWDFDYLEGCFSNIQHWNSFWPAIGPWSESKAAWHGIEAAIASPNVSNGSGKGVRMGSILIQFPVISSPKLLEDRDVIIIYCHYHSIFIMIYYDLLWSIDLYIYIIFKLFNMVDLWYLCWFKDMSWSSHQVLDASSC